jgi:8-oxo-dGTP pyrophosphatase MutT (NUDIX family)
VIRPSVECWLVRPGPNGIVGVLLLHAPERPGVRPALWQPVSGGVEAGESPSQACLREVREESGFTLADAALAPVADGLALVISPEVTLLKSVYVAVAPNGEVRCDPAEHDGFDWVPTGEVPGRLVRDSHRATWSMAAEVVAALTSA